MPACLRCGTELVVNEEGVAPVLCDACAGKASSRARRSVNTGAMSDFPVTTGLLAVNLAVFVGMVITGGGFFKANGNSLILWQGNFDFLTLSGEYWRLLTAAFVHDGVLHIAFNMWCLWSLGQLSERLFGRWQTLLIYAMTGIGGSLLSIAHAVSQDQARLSVGASGAVFGIAGALLAGLKFGNLSISEGARRGILSSLAFFIIVNFVLGMGQNVDNMAHLGGFISGLIIGLPLALGRAASGATHRLLQIATLLISSLLLAGATNELVQVHGHKSRIFVSQWAMSRGDFPAAIKVLERDVRANPNDAQAQGELAYAFAMDNQRDNAIAAYKRALQLDPNDARSKTNLKLLEEEAQEQQPQK